MSACLPHGTYANLYRAHVTRLGSQGTLVQRIDHLVTFDVNVHLLADLRAASVTHTAEEKGRIITEFITLSRFPYSPCTWSPLICDRPSSPLVPTPTPFPYFHPARELRLDINEFV